MFGCFEIATFLVLILDRFPINNLKLIFCEWIFGIIFLLEVVLNVRAMEVDKFVDTLV